MYRKWLFLFCSFVLLLLSWFIQPETARAWLMKRYHSLTQTMAGAPDPAGTDQLLGLDEMGAHLRDPNLTGHDGPRLMIYLPSRSESGLLEAVEARINPAETPKELVIEVINLLARPPQELARPPAIPEGTRVLTVFVEKDRLFVDLSEDLLRLRPESTVEVRQRLYSLVNSLTSLPFANEVRFLVGNSERTRLAGLFDLTASYRFNRRIVAPAGIGTGNR